MTALLWQTALLLLGAYFLGAFTGCLIRRTFFAAMPADPALPQSSHAPAPPRRLPDPEPIMVPATAEPAGHAAASTRFDRALSGHGVAADGGAGQSHVTPASPEDDEIPAQPIVARPRSAPAPAAVPWAPAPSPAAADTVAPKPTARGTQVRHADKPGPLAQDANQPIGQPGALARSVGTSAAAAAALAAATARHQAAQTALQKEAASSATSGPSSTLAPASPAPVAPSQPAAPVPVAAAAKPAAPDDLTRIRAIDPELQTRLNQLGIHRFAEIAGWRRSDIRRLNEALGFRGRIEQENWIEQAQILLGGGETAYSRRRRGAQPLAKPSADQGERRPITTKPRLGAAASGMAAAVAASVAAAPRRPVMALGRDNLQRIRPISEDVERLLNVQGISRYDQIAHWTAPDVTRFERLLGSDGRISRENWIEQAQVLAGGGETAYAREFDKRHAATAPAGPRPTQLAEAIRTASQGSARKVDLTKLRSVRSEAGFHGENAGQAGVVAAGLQPVPQTDDLKRIRGVGVLIEKRLYGMGYRTYEQVANWTAADVDRVSRALEFRGRIERENWIEQARILASGGKTEFARRVDSGEVETPQRP